MSVIRVDDAWQEQWNVFVKQAAGDGGFLQSWQWGTVQKELGHKIFRLAHVDSTGAIDGVALIVKHELPFEYNYLYIPRGPITDNAEVVKEILDESRTIAMEEKSFMLRLDPAWLVGHEEALTAVGCRKCDSEMQPKCAMVVNVGRPVDEVLNTMKQKTRYNIQVARRREVVVRASDEPTAIEYFWQLTKQTAERNHFKPHPKEHYKKLFDLLSPDGTIQMFLAEYQGKVIGTLMVAFFGNTAVYLHGASADTYRDVMAAYLLQWEAMQAAMSRGCQWYDFGGVNGKTFENPKWEGITRFKTGFSDVAPREYVGCYELIFNPFIFAAYTFIRQIKE